MSLSTFSPKRAGGGHSKSFDSSTARLIANHWGTTPLLFFAIVAGLLLLPSRSAEIFKPSKAAANSCNAKLRQLEENAAREASQNQTIVFTQNEVNSYLALDLSRDYHPCLKSLFISFEENQLLGTAAIDFDRLEASSSKILPKLIGLLLSGTHTISARGRLLSQNGKANFQLKQASFDGSTLPKSLIEEIITLVGQKQTPPFDPLEPSSLPYKIQRIDVHAGYVLVYQ